MSTGLVIIEDEVEHNKNSKDCVVKAEGPKKSWQTL